MDCSGRYGNRGCQGGWPIWGYEYVKDNGGIDTEISYPYRAYHQSCHFSKKTIGATEKGYVALPKGIGCLKDV